MLDRLVKLIKNLVTNEVFGSSRITATFTGMANASTDDKKEVRQ
jgi:hypothetical protein